MQHRNKRSRSRLRSVVAALLVLVVRPFPLSAAPASIVPASSSGPTETVEVRISASNDDAEEEGADGTDPGQVHARSTDLELAEDTEPESWGHQVIGMRFGPLAIPPGARITHAEVTFTAVPADPPNTNDGPTALTVAGQADAAPAAFAETRSDISGRTRTTATVAWSPDPWTAGTTYVTPDLTAVVQEVIDLTTWRSGSSIALFVTGSGSRSAASFDGSAQDAPLLRVEFTSAAPPAGHFAYVPLAARYDGTAARLDNGDFEQGAGGWEEYSSHAVPVITDDFTRVELTPHSGQWAAWLGGLDDETSWIQQRIVVPDPAVPLVYWEWIASAEESCAYDGAAISIDGAVLQQFGLCSASDTHAWVRRDIDLAAYAGRTVTLRITVVTDTSVNSNYFVDDLSFGPGQ